MALQLEAATVRRHVRAATCRRLAAGGVEPPPLPVDRRHEPLPHVLRLGLGWRERL